MREKAKGKIDEKKDEIVRLIEKGYTVTIRPTKDGVKITSHREKVV